MSISFEIRPGRSYPLGATPDVDGVNFAVFSDHATRIELCLFNGDREITRLDLPERTANIWHGYIPGLRPGAEYGFRAYGKWEPKHGLRFNPAKLQLDPYSRGLTGHVKPGPLCLDYVPEPDGSPAMTADKRDSAPEMPRSVVIDPGFDWGNDTSPRVPLAETVIYETHVRGFTRLFEAVPAELRGTYAGMGSQPALDYLRWLGITAVELLPVHAFVQDTRLAHLGLCNYWGYNSIGFFAPEPTYASTPDPQSAVREFKQMVKNLHAAGLEVILDVVYNHTGEGNHLGPSLALRGIDHASYYRLSPNDATFLLDFTGTGNSLNVQHPRVLQMICDSLRYWVQEMHVDGFRFDLATTLGRDETGFHDGAAFFDLLLQDPILSQVKLIAEPWDIGDYGYQVGGFPHPWSEWNGRYRDALRLFWRGSHGFVDDLASRVAGSSDIYLWRKKGPTASINFISSHDGFTLRDLVSYNDKHNAANGEDNRDGDNHNMSWNCGAEGPTNDAEINRLRRRQQRNFLATLFLSQGVPMIGEGDEYGRTKKGNNNTYCQDNELNWLVWDRDEDMRRLEVFTQRLIQFRKEHPVFRQTKYLVYRTIADGGADLAWFSATGRTMTIEEWNDERTLTVGMFLSGARIPEDQRTFFVIFHAGADETPFTLPGRDTCRWRTLMDTATEDGFVAGDTISAAGDTVKLTSRSLRLFELCEGTPLHAQEERPQAVTKNAPPSENTPASPTIR